MDDLTENYLLLADAYWRMAQAAFPRGTITDVFFWEEPKSPRSPGRSPNIALVGDAQRMSVLFGMGLEEDAQAAPFLASAIGRAVKNVMGVTTGHPSDWRDSELNLHDFLQRLGGQTSFQWADANDLSIGDEIRFTFIPEPGWPWPTDGDRYWSARLKRWLPSKKPDWVIMVPDPNSPSQLPAYGADPCRIFPPDETKTQSGGPVCGDLNGQKIMVTHAMQLLISESRHHKQIDVATEGIKRCGGLLFPSLAVGPIPATNFGPIVLVAHLELVLDSLSPYRKRGRRPCWVYGTDAWTETTGSFLGNTAVELFDELHGYSDWLHRSMAILGISASSYGASGQWHDPLKSTKNLSTALKRAMRGWTPTLTSDQMKAKEEEGYSTGVSKYAYLEAKAREVVRLDEFPFIVAPTFLREPLTRFTSSLGYTGEVVFRTPAPWIERALMEEGHKDRDYALYVWSWEVAKVVEGLRPVVKVLT